MATEGIEPPATVYIDDLDSSLPDGAVDEVRILDNHSRGIKNVLKLTFAAITGAVTASQDDLNELSGMGVGGLLKAMYPVGSIYLSTVATNPATLIGGSWTALGDKQTLVQQGTYTAGSTGGSSTAVNVSHNHTFTGSELASHAHTYDSSIGGTGSAYPTGVGTYQQRNTSSVSAGTPAGSISTNGASGTNANMPPYLAIYMWRRTA